MRMKMKMCFLLLLLICSLSTAQLQTDSDSKDSALGKKNETQRSDQKNALDHQQSCPPDLHAVLREMSASLAEQRVEIRHLQAENEAHAAKLREVDKQKTELDKQKTELEKQQQQLQVRQVAFSASLLASGKGHVGPFNTHTLLVFRHVLSNIGNAYNPNTGFFTAPVRGAYHFEVYIAAVGHDSIPSIAVLVKNGEIVFSTNESQPSHFGKAANGATLLLETGDVVFLHLWRNSRIYDDRFHHSTFSGHLLFIM
ncbi:complement C1q-like protein 2 [Halichoeres trimaculatus]|uniref:complement C1q-like protein 2 n=1 Tax=Halichoeres trimaculatus TaxID=147232 RepID=UPI003D9EFA1A